MARECTTPLEAGDKGGKKGRSQKGGKALFGGKTKGHVKGVGKAGSWKAKKRWVPGNVLGVRESGTQARGGGVPGKRGSARGRLRNACLGSWGVPGDDRWRRLRVARGGGRKPKHESDEQIEMPKK